VLLTALLAQFRTGPPPGAELAENPLKRVKMKRVAADDCLDPRVVVTPAQARELLAAVSYVGSWNRGRGRRLVAFFAVLY
jgi:hypothetical protein